MHSKLQTTHINMSLQFSFSHFVFFFIFFTPTFSASIAKHGCPKKCGTVKIRYPFGVGSECSMDTSFDIVCNHSTNPPKPYLNITKSKQVEVVEIHPTHIRVKYPYPLAAVCYNNTSVYPHNITRDDYYSLIDLRGTKYVLSDQNWLTALGCDDTVAGFGRQYNQTFTRGCVSSCANSNSDGLGFCPNGKKRHSARNGCCRTPLPKGTTILGAQLSDSSGRWVRDKFFPCGYAFVEEKRHKKKSKSSFPLSELNKSKVSHNDNWTLTSTPPVVRLDWRVGAENCSEAWRNSTTYACKSNSVCVDLEVDEWEHGYLCYCKKGYHGNAYLDNGCEGINECHDHHAKGKDCIQSKSRIVNIIIGVGSAIGFILLLISIYILRHKLFPKRRKNKICTENFLEQNSGLLKQHTNEDIIQITKLFSAKELEKATDNFNESRILGQGGQGTVYKGMLSDGSIVAIKKSNFVTHLKLFINEIVIASQIIHKNVVTLWGCCLETEVPLLVYELMPNGTLLDLIHDPVAGFQVSWNVRLQIASDVAAAIAYLHSALPVRIFHRDIKSSNILLDEEYNAKLSDFGISRSVAADQTFWTSTSTRPKGTFGYLDPQYLASKLFTEKSDVYSFGVVLVELLTGQKALPSDEDERILAVRFRENNFHTMLDPRVFNEENREEVIAVARLAQRCLNVEGEMRPTMKEVVTRLGKLSLCEEAQVCDETKSPVSALNDECARTSSGYIEELLLGRKPN